MKTDLFTFKLTVPPEAIDELDHVNNVTYLQWCLDAAEKHWISKTSRSIRDTYVWIVLNHNISYKNPAFKGEELEVKTRITSYEGVKSIREYRIIRPADNKILVEAETLWCFLNAKTRRPMRIPAEIAALFVNGVSG